MNIVAFENLREEIAHQPEATVSRTLHRDDAVKVVLFAFAAGQELSEHTAAVPAILHFLDGKGRVTIDGREYTVCAGSWFYLPAHTPHTVQAATPLTMLLTLLMGARSG